MLRFTCVNHRFKVTVLGAAGSIGQHLCLGLKCNKRVSELRLYDIVDPAGTAMDVSHVPSTVAVSSFTGANLAKSLDGADVVILTAGKARQPGMHREDLFQVNAAVVESLMSAVAKACPRATLGLVSDPMNSLIAVAAATLEEAGAYDQRKLFGLTTLDVYRARTLFATAAGVNPFDVNVPVVGGHSGSTIVPLFSSCSPALPPHVIEDLTFKLRWAGDEVVKAKAGAGSSVLAAAKAAMEWADAVLRAKEGEEGVELCALVENPAYRCRFFASPVRLGVDGIAELLPLPALSSAEQELLDLCLSDLEINVRKGLKYVHKKHLFGRKNLS